METALCDQGSLSFRPIFPLHISMFSFPCATLAGIDRFMPGVGMENALDSSFAALLVN